VVVAPLDRKLFRDLWRLRGQALAIALIVASGVAVLVMSLSAMDALSDSSRAYYRQYRFADVFASLKRAPVSLERDISAIDGVQLVDPRVVQFAVLDMPRLDEPVIGRLVSLPDEGEPMLNRLALTTGRLPDPDRRDEVVVGEPFAGAHGLEIGDRFNALLNGRRRALEVAGIGLSPEFVYAIGPGALMPDAEHYGIVWMRNKALAAAYDLEGAFNDLTLTLYPGVAPDRVLQELDELLARFGGVGAHSREDQISHWFLANEIEQLKTLARILPAIFLLVAAFLTNTVLARLVYMERPEIGLLKAFGYGNATVVWHYAKLVVVLSLLGLVLGWAGGFWLGYWMTTVYADMFRFPALVFQPPASTYVISLVVAVGSSLIGVIGAARYAGSLPPAEAMQPPAPPVFRHHFSRPAGLITRLDQPTRIIFRQVFRKPFRSLLTSLGLAASVGLLVVSMQWMDAIEYMIDEYFVRQQRQDMTLGFVETQPLEVVQEALRLPGVLAVEPMRSASVRFRAGHRSHREGLTGLPIDGGLTGLYDADGRLVRVPPEGLLLSQTLATKLRVGVGDVIRVEMLEGRRAELDMQVGSVFETVIGMPAYVSLTTLNRALAEPDTTNMLQLVIDEAQQRELYARLKKLASIGGVTLKAAAVDMFNETIGETMMVMVFFYLSFACTMAFGMVYNNLRIALSERGRELATLRVLGFRPGEISYMLFGEAGLLIVAGLPLGCLAGWGLAELIAASFDTELYRVPVRIEPSTYGLAVVIALATVVPCVVLLQRRLSRLNLISVLKTRE
jgi:putative ABC transport system permease protein